MAGISEFLTGRDQSIQQVPTLTPQQQGTQSQIQGQLGPLLQRLSGGFQGQRKEAIRQFEEQGVPSILERLTSMGGGRSSAVGQQIGSARAGLESQLAGQEGEFDQRLLQMLLGFGQQQGTENIINPERQGILQKSATGLAGGIGTGAGIWGATKLGGMLGSLGGPVGGATGAAAGGGVAGLLALMKLLSGKGN